ncbi:MAG: hypothetical protein QXI16_01280 [Sulfolobaceae archaeon]
MVDLPLWDIIKLFRDALIALSTAFHDILMKPLLEVVIFPKDVVIFGFNLTAYFSEWILSNKLTSVTLLEILLGSGMITIVGLIAFKKLIPIA